MKDYIIIMADIIGSRRTNEINLMEAFKEIVLENNQKYAHRFLSPLTITLGDEFQGVTNSLKSAVETIVSIEESIIGKRREFKLRYVVNEGVIETALNSKIAHGMLGEGLTVAREKLNSLKDSNSRIHFTLRNQDKSTVLNESFSLYTWLIDTWKHKDFELISAFWKYKDYKQVAAKMDKNTSLMWKRQKSLNLKEYKSIKNIIQYLS